MNIKNQDTIDSGNVFSISLSDQIHPDNYDWPSADAVQSSLELVLDHFVKHSKVVQQKLEIAKEATAQGIEDLEKICDAYDFDENMPVLRNVKSYESMWDEILERFEERGVTEEELHKIEHILLRIPNTIKIHYESLITDNKRLEETIRALESDEYQDAFKLVQEIQQRPNPMSNMSPDDYDRELEEAKQKTARDKSELIAAEQSFKIIID